MNDFVNTYSEFHISRNEKIKLFLSELKDSLSEKHPSNRLPITFLKALEKQFDENAISDYLAYILDGRRNGIGYGPIRAVIEHFGINSSRIDFSSMNVIREFTFIGGGRIDLLITIDNSLVIAVENKIFSPEGFMQTLSYKKSLDQKFSDIDKLLIFLAPGKQVAQSPNFRSLSYTELHQILLGVDFSVASGEKYRQLYLDFLTHIQEYISMDKPIPDLSDLTKLYLEHYSEIEEVVSAYKADSEDLYNYISNKIAYSFEGPAWVHDKQQYYQLMYREHWFSEHLRLFFVFHLSKEILLADKFHMTFEVQGYRNEWNKSPFIDKFISEFSQVYPQVIDQCSDLGMKVQPVSKPYALASKHYEIQSDPESIEQAVEVAIEEFSFLIDPIDEFVRNGQQIPGD